MGQAGGHVGPEIGRLRRGPNARSPGSLSPGTGTPWGRRALAPARASADDARAMPGLSADPEKAARQKAALAAGRRKQALARLGLSEADVPSPKDPAGGAVAEAASPAGGPGTTSSETTGPPGPGAASSPAVGNGPSSRSAPQEVAGLPVRDPSAHMTAAAPGPAAPTEK